MIDRWIRRCKKRRPAGTTLAANASLPMRDRSSLLVDDHLPNQDLVREVMSCSLVRGSLSCCSEESSSMPRKVRQVAGPSDFSMATGMPSSWQTCLMVDMRNAACRSSEVAMRAPLLSLPRRATALSMVE